MPAAYVEQLAQTRAPEAEIHALMEKYMDLWNRHAITEHTELFTEDADLVNVIGHHAHGRQQIRQQHEQLHRTIFSSMSSRIVDLSVTLLADTVALAHLRWEMRGAARVPGWTVPDPRTGAMTLVWTKQHGEWRVRALQNTDEIPVPPLPES